MPMAGKFCTLSFRGAYHNFSPFYTIISELIQSLPFTCSGWDLDKTVIRSMKQVVPRSSILGFKDDYYRIDTDVVLMEGEIHAGRKPVSIAPRFRTHTFLHDGRY
jgi:hypothetical protein